MDVKTTFFHGSFKEEFYVEQFEVFEVQHCKTHVCRFKKLLYGWKQALRAWDDSFLMKLGFTRSDVDPNLYFKVKKDRTLILVFMWMIYF